MTHVYASSDTALEVLKPNEHEFNLVIDNITFYPRTPDDHQFAGILVAKEDAALFIANLAKAMGLTVRMETVPAPADWRGAVTVTDNTTNEWWESGEPNFTISGDIDDILNDDERAQLRAKWETLEDSSTRGSWTSNYYVSDLLQEGAGGFTPEYTSAPAYEFEAEGSCFFAYTSNREKADDLAAWINGKRFLR